MRNVGDPVGDSPGVQEGVTESAAGEPLVTEGGCIPGHHGLPAWTLRRVEPSSIPVVLAVPHAGRAYARTLLDRMRHPTFAAPRLEDRYVDLIGLVVARRTGAALLVANAPRALIDLNRATDDVDWDMVGPPPDASAQVRAPGGPGGLVHRARSGLGLVPRRLPGLGELWKRRLDHHELEDRIAAVHEPYHAVLAETLADVRDRWGAALLIDLHSMPPLAARSCGETAPEFVVGDRFGAACDGALVASVFSFFAQAGRIAAHNRPYAGGYVLERHARRSAGIHCLQLEIDRQCYLDSRLAEPGPGFDAMADTVTALVRRIASDVSEMGREQRHWRAAAE